MSLNKGLFEPLLTDASLWLCEWYIERCEGREAWYLLPTDAWDSVQAQERFTGKIIRQEKIMVHHSEVYASPNMSAVRGGDGTGVEKGFGLT